MNLPVPVFLHLSLFLLGSAIASLVFYFDDNVFIVDYYAKRIGFIFAACGICIQCLVKPESVRLSRRYIAFFGFCVVVFLVRGVGVGNPIASISVEILQLTAIFVFFVLSMQSDFTKSALRSFTVGISIWCALLVVMGIKLQFSYAGFLLPFLVLLGYRPHSSWLILPISLLAVISFFESLLGKSALIFLAIVFVTTFRFRNFLSRRFYLLGATVLLVGGLSFFLNPDLFYNSEAVQKTKLFASYNFDEGDFDVSTAQRIFEASRVLAEIDEGGALTALIGNGFGAGIDMSSTADDSVRGVHADLGNVRNVHLLVFYIGLKYGLLGVLVAYTGMVLLLKNAVAMIKHTGRLGSEPTTRVWFVYVLLILIDGQVSAGHLMSNPLFFFAAAVTLTQRVEKPLSITVRHLSKSQQWRLNGPAIPKA